MSEYFEVLCIYGDDRKLIIFKHTMNFKEKLCRKFGINSIIKLIHNDLNAEITSKLSIKPNMSFRIIVEEIQVQNKDTNLLYLGMGHQRQMEIANENQNNQVVYYNELVGRKFKKEFIDELNVWANSKEFHLIFSEGPKKLKKEIKRTLSCINKGCNYKLIMKSDDQNDNFEVYGKLSKKYMEHSKLINFIFKLHFLRSRICL